MGKDKETNLEPVDPPDREDGDTEDLDAPETAPVDPPDHQGGGGRT